MSDELIIGSAMIKNDLRPFLKSLNETSFRGKLILFCTEDTEILTENFNFELIYIDPFKDLKNEIFLHKAMKKVCRKFKISKWWKGVNQKSYLNSDKIKKPITKWQTSFFVVNYSIMVSRFFMYKYFINKYDTSKIFFSDVFDVYFQNNPCDVVTQEGVVYIFSEDIPISKEPATREWIRMAYGDSILNSIFEEDVICSGTITGTSTSMKNFLNDFLNILVSEDIVDSSHGMDQATLNYMATYLKIKYFKKYKNGDFIFTVGTVSPQIISISDKGIFSENYSVLPSVIHQYNRHTNLMTYIEQKVSSYA